MQRQSDCPRRHIYNLSPNVERYHHLKPKSISASFRYMNIAYTEDFKEK